LRCVRADPARRCESSLIIWIVILLLFIASLVAAYFASRYWHWAHVTLVVFIFLAAVGYFVLAAEVLRINAVLRKQANDLEAQLAQAKSNIDALDRGSKSTQVINQLLGLEVHIPEEAEEVPSTSELEHRLYLVTRLRGRVWRKVAPAGFDPQTGTVKVTVESPQPSGIEPGRIMFLFEDGPPAHPDPTQGPQYLGEFRVTDAAAQQVTLVTVNELDGVEKERLARSPGNWALYESMPVDQLDLFAGKNADELRKLLPEASVEEYIRQGTPAGPDDDEWHVVGYDEEGNLLGPNDIGKAVKKVYQRRLRDYATEFGELNRQRVMLMASVAGVTEDNARLKAAQASAEKLSAFREEEIRKLNVDLAGVTKERALIEKHLATVEQQLATTRKLLDQAIAENRRLSDDLTRRENERLQRSGSAPVRGPLAATP
jgi:hypothetical protein